MVLGMDPRPYRLSYGDLTLHGGVRGKPLVELAGDDVADVGSTPPEWVIHRCAPLRYVWSYLPVRV